MKKTRSLLALTLTLLLLLSIGTCAFAADAKYAPTKKYVEAMAELDGATCTVDGDMLTLGNSTFERVKVDYDGDGDISKYKSHFNVFFTDESADQPIQILMSMRIMNFDEKDLADVLSDVNAYNANSASVKLYADTSDNSIMAELYLLANEATVQDISLFATGLFIRFTDNAYESLEKYEAAA